MVVYTANYAAIACYLQASVVITIITCQLPATHLILFRCCFLCVLLLLWLMNTITLVSGVTGVLTVKTDTNGAWGDSSSITYAI